MALNHDTEHYIVDFISRARWDWTGRADYWATDYNWREREARLNRFNHFITEVNGTNIHFIKADGQGPNHVPLLLLQGWPSSFVQVLDIIPLLTEARDDGTPLGNEHARSARLTSRTYSLTYGLKIGHGKGQESVAAALKQSQTPALRVPFCFHYHRRKARFGPAHHREHLEKHGRCRLLVYYCKPALPWITPASQPQGRRQQRV